LARVLVGDAAMRRWLGMLQQDVGITDDTDDDFAGTARGPVV
jgi:hypothetical protein